ncbi:hypothetical protein J3U01_06205 [Bifidobacterium sp. B4107]|uniref:hypothetical protein n=1 Tax=unclassified Bifidobacterium TaxID=2608897 RepID=UPI00226B30E4|nr:MULTISPECIES: hypothetical protein [unclassified Bifidobacterium]MCX8647998.1 hypothetical protein [Bifidobacterium sp. B4107]MCX8652355.1 hypothetical protein [Bifidobacterium sp. B4111]MCX8658954.1 hypothetical protein [Bifidobacterium sp. B4114]MCX8687598.1 hypothetical protein [Bifidobacterium sp. B4142]
MAVVTTSKTKGMTYRYTVNIVAPGDLRNFVQHVITIIYITPPPSHPGGRLTGIKVNGHDIQHFNPDTRQYTVEVPRTDQWTIVPQYDERSGMSVHTHKNGADASITTTSADGLVTRNYTSTSPPPDIREQKTASPGYWPKSKAASPRSSSRAFCSSFVPFFRSCSPAGAGPGGDKPVTVMMHTPRQGDAPQNVENRPWRSGLPGNPTNVGEWSWWQSVM